MRRQCPLRSYLLHYVGNQSQQLHNTAPQRLCQWKESLIDLGKLPVVGIRQRKGKDIWDALLQNKLFNKWISYWTHKGTLYSHGKWVDGLDVPSMCAPRDSG